jgi:hypothetical protein
MTSPDGITWTLRTTSEVGAAAQNIADSGSVLVSGNRSNNSNSTSPDGLTWTGHAALAIGGGVTGIAFGAGLFVANGPSPGPNEIWNSTDGVTWSAQSWPSGTAWEAICYSPALGMFVSVAGSGGAAGHQVMTSTNGLTWINGSTPAGADGLVWKFITAAA